MQNPQLTIPEIVSSLKLTRKPYATQAKEWADSQDLLERGFRWDMGTGKTLAAVGFLRLKYRKYGKVGNTLILAPLATMGGWKKTFETESPESVHKQVVIAAGFGKKKLPGKRRAALIADPNARIVVTNYATLILPEALAALQAKGFEYIVIDEIDEFKNPDAKRLKNLLTFSDAAPARLGMTGTLLTNKLFDVWGPCRILDRGQRFGTNFYSHFRRKYFTDINAGMPSHIHFPDWKPNGDSADLVAAKLATLFSDVQKSQCLDLPPIVRMQEQVELGEEQSRLYTEMEEDLVAYADNGEATAQNALVKLLRCRQILAGFVSYENEEDPGTQKIQVFKSNPRLERLRELLKQLTPAHKVVVWSCFRATYPMLREMATDLGIGFAELHGDTKDRQGEIDRFQNDPNCRVFFSNAKAGGVGVDGLQHVADYCVYYDRDHSLRAYLQSRDRTYRGGSEVHAKITEVHLVAPQAAVELGIMASLEGKEEFAEDLLRRLRSIHGLSKALES